MKIPCHNLFDTNCFQKHLFKSINQKMCYNLYPLFSGTILSQQFDDKNQKQQQLKCKGKVKLFRRRLRVPMQVMKCCCLKVRICFKEKFEIQAY